MNIELENIDNEMRIKPPVSPMKTLILSIINGFFAREENEPQKLNTNSIFLKDTDSNTKRILIIEEDEYNIWVYVLSIDKKEIDFEGFLCTVVSPIKSDIANRDIHKKEAPMPIKYTNKYSWVKNLKKEHIKVDWQDNIVNVWIKDKLYLIMNTDTKTSYSKGLSSDCRYGKKMIKDLKE